MIKKRNYGAIAHYIRNGIPFCCPIGDPPLEYVGHFLDLFVELGASPYAGLEGFNKKEYFVNIFVGINSLLYFGVDDLGRTYLDYDPFNFHIGKKLIVLNSSQLACAISSDNIIKDNYLGAILHGNK